MSEDNTFCNFEDTIWTEILGIPAVTAETPDFSDLLLSNDFFVKVDYSAVPSLPVAVIDLTKIVGHARPMQPCRPYCQEAAKDIDSPL